MRVAVVDDLRMDAENLRGMLDRRAALRHVH